MWRIKRWDETFENRVTRKLRKLERVQLPIDFGSTGYGVLMAEPDGPATYGAWVAIAALAATCHPRGDLVRSDGRPHSAESIAAAVRMPLAVVTSAIARLTGDEVAWLESVEAGAYTVRGQACERAPAQASARMPAVEGRGEEGRGEDRTGEEGIPACAGDAHEKSETHQIAKLTRDTPEALRETWNRLRAPEWAEWRAMPPKRTRMAALRLATRGIDGPSGWAAVLLRLSVSGFARGRNDRGWVATPEFLLAADTADKILEGRYDDRGRRNGAGDEGRIARAKARIDAMAIDAGTEQPDERR